MPAPAHISHESDSEHPTPRKHSIYVHFPKDRNYEVYLRTKMTRALCRKRTGEAVPRAEKFGDLITAEHKVPVKVVNLETVTDTQSWCKTWPPNGSSRIRAKQKLLRKHNGACKSS